MKRIDMRIVFGVMLILGGALALLETLGYLKNASDIFWGGVFIAAGLGFLAVMFNGQWWGAFPGFTLVALGVSRILPESLGDFRGAIFLGGIALNLSNPKPALFYAALILSVFPEPMGPGRQGLIYAICLATELFWYATVAVLMSTATMRSRYFAAKFWIDRTAAIAMAALGLLLIVKH